MQENQQAQEAIQEPLWSDLKLFKNIYTNTRTAFRYIDENDYTKYRFLLLVLFSISGTVNVLILRNLFSLNFRISEKDVFIIILSAVLAIGMFIIYSKVIKWVGSYLGAAKPGKMVLEVFVYSAFPLALNVVILFFQAVLLPPSSLENVGYFALTLLWVSKILQLFLYFWWLLVLVRGLSEVQEAPNYTAFMTIVLSGTFIRLVIWLVVAIFAFVQYLLK